MVKSQCSGLGGLVTVCSSWSNNRRSSFGGLVQWSGPGGLVPVSWSSWSDLRSFLETGHVHCSVVRLLCHQSLSATNAPKLSGQHRRFGQK